MDTKWLEDFVSLAETRSFSRSAQLRHVTQSAFSRRIQALEAWAGTDLIDRSSYPTRLTPAGETLYDQSIEMLQGLQSTRAMLRGHTAAGQDVVEFAVPHTLAFTFFPAWVSRLRGKIDPLKCRLTALNVHDAVQRLVEGRCDLMIAYHHDAQPLQLDAEHYDMLTLGQDVLAPYVKPAADGTPLFALPGLVGQPLPYLAYAPEAYLGHAVDWRLKASATPIHLDRVYETDIAEGLKAMALEGHGMAFLPLSAVLKEVRAKTLVSAGAGLDMALDVRIYRQRPNAKQTPRSQASALWDALQSQAVAKPAGRLLA
ncbi:MAG: LysR substrate-binding domain-containing protein [Polaromonas sp.]|nr:LysR substrate-binding domain-containing protein [Polaromonas sp.]